MKLFLPAIILTTSFIAYGQQGIPSPNSAPGAYAPHPNPTGMDAPPPAEQPPNDVFQQDRKLAVKLQKLLPAGTTPQQFCDGFKTLGACVAAMHVAQNLEIVPSDLKTKITDSKSKKEPERLESAIHDLKPTVDAKAERKKAQKQAERDTPVSN